MFQNISSQLIILKNSKDTQSKKRTITMKLSQYDPELYGIMSQITGSELLFLLKRIGITQKRYGLQLDPPLHTASAVNNYSTHKQLPFRMIAPLLDSYPADFLLHLLEEYPKRRNH